MQISDRAKRLIEALHEPQSNEKRWEIAQRYLDEEGLVAVQSYLWRENKPGATFGFVPLSEKIAQDRGHDEFP